MYFVYRVYKYHCTFIKCTQCTHCTQCTQCTPGLCRCSGQGELAADALSKGEWEAAWAAMPDKNTDPGRIPASLLLWINDPVPDLNLGRKILLDMMAYTKVLVLK